MAAPFTRDHCPVCAAETKQRFLAPTGPSPGAEVELTTICEVCQTVLIYYEHGLVGQRRATALERSACPPPPSSEEMAAMREELRQGQADYQAWLKAGCPGLTAEISERLEALGVRLPPLKPSGDGSDPGDLRNRAGSR
jgi:hypothetical protein